MVCGHFGLGRFGLDISAKENAKGGRFGHNHKLWVGVCCDAFLSTIIYMYTILLPKFYQLLNCMYLQTEMKTI